MSGHSRSARPSVPTDRQRRQLRVALVAIAAAVLIIGGLVYELYAQRVTARAAVKKLACFAVEYASDSNPTVHDIRQFYGCPPQKKPPARPPAKATPPRPAVTTTTTVYGQPSGGATPAAPPASPSGTTQAAPRATRTPAVVPSSTSVVPGRPSSAPPVLGSIVCTVFRFPTC